MPQEPSYGQIKFSPYDPTKHLNLIIDGVETGFVLVQTVKEDRKIVETTNWGTILRVKAYPAPPYVSQHCLS